MRAAGHVPARASLAGDCMECRGLSFACATAAAADNCNLEGFKVLGLEFTGLYCESTYMPFDSQARVNSSPRTAGARASLAGDCMDCGGVSFACATAAAGGI